MAKWISSIRWSGSTSSLLEKQFQGNVPVLRLPYDYERPAIQSFEGDSVHFTLDEEMAEGLREVARKEGDAAYGSIVSIQYSFIQVQWAGGYCCRSTGGR